MGMMEKKTNYSILGYVYIYIDEIHTPIMEKQMENDMKTEPQFLSGLQQLKR